MPKVSALMPIYNSNVQYLRETIESILNQTFSDFEFLILNDSPENTALDDIIASYKDTRIKYFKNEYNMGISESRNKLIDLSCGEYLAVIDHDDISMPNRFELEVACLDEHPQVGVVSSQIQFSNNNNTTYYPNKDKHIKQWLCKGFEVLHPQSMMRKSVLLKNNIRYNKEYYPAEDYDLWAKLIPYTQFHILKDSLLIYRVHEKNTSRTYNDLTFYNGQNIMQRIRKEYSNIYEMAKHNIAVSKVYRVFCIPILKIVSFKNKKKIYLFKNIPFISIRTSEDFMWNE